MQNQLSKLLVLLTFTLISLTSFAEDSELQSLQKQLAEAKEKIVILTKENENLKSTLAFKENEAAGHRFRLESIEAEIAALKENN